MIQSSLFLFLLSADITFESSNIYLCHKMPLTITYRCKCLRVIFGGFPLLFHILGISYPCSLFDSEIFTFKWLLMCCIAVAVLALKTNPFLQSYLPTSVSPDGLQFKNAFCNYNIWHICELPNSYFSFSPCIKIKCCLLNCKSFNLWPLHLCFG